MDVRELYRVLVKHYGWTPQQIGQLTLAQALAMATMV